MASNDLSNAGRSDMIKSVYTGFRNAGLSHEASLVMLGEVGRENAFNPKYIFGSHSDDANRQTNIGMISWQGPRKSALERTLASRGLLSNGQMARNQDTINAQAQFLVDEMKVDSPQVYKYLTGNNVQPQQGMDLVGGRFIRWAINNPKYRENGIRNRQFFYDEALRVVGNQAAPAPAAQAAATAVAPTPTAGITLPPGTPPPLPGDGPAPAGLPTALPPVTPMPDLPAGAPGVNPVGLGPQIAAPYQVDDAAIQANRASAGQSMESSLEQDRRHREAMAADGNKFRPPTMGDLERGLTFNTDPRDVFDGEAYSNAQRQKWQAIQDARESTTLGDKYAAANFQSMHPVMEFFTKPDFAPEQGFSSRQYFNDNKNIDVNALDERAFDRIRNATSTQEANHEMEQWRMRQEANDTLSRGSQFTSGAMTMAATLANPVYASTFVVGGPVIAGLRGVGVIGRTTLAGMTVGSQVARFGAEAAIEGAAFSTVRYALGETVTLSDVITDVGVGALAGMGLSLLTGGVKRAIREQVQFEGHRAAEIFRDAKKASETKSAEYHQRAYEDLGITVEDVAARSTPEVAQEVARRVAQYESEDIARVMRVAMADVPQAEKLIDNLTNPENAFRMKRADAVLDEWAKVNQENVRRAALREARDAVDQAVTPVAAQVDEAVSVAREAAETVARSPVGRAISEIVRKADEFSLPASIAKSAPRYKQFEIVFANDFDRAAYILGNDAKGASRGAGKFRQALKDQGIDPKAAAQYGQRMRDAIKAKVGKANIGPAINTSGLVSPADKARILGAKEIANNIDNIPQARLNDQVAGRTIADEAQRAPERPNATVEDLSVLPNKSLEQIQDELGIMTEFRDMDLKEGLMSTMLQERAVQMRKANEAGMSGRKNELATRMNKWYFGQLEALNPDGTILRGSKSDILKNVAELVENPTGSTGKRTAALTKYALEKIYLGEVEEKYQVALNAFYRKNNRNPATQILDQDLRKKFDRELFLYHINKAENPAANLTNPNREILEEASSHFQSAFDKMRVSQIQADVRGAVNLPETSVGYLPFRVSPEKWQELTAGQRISYARAMSKAIMDANPEFTADEAFGLANSWVRHMTNKSVAEQYITTTPWSRRGAAEVEEAIAAMEGSPEMKAALLAKYRKGQASHTKSRIDRSLTQQFQDADGNSFMLADVMEHDMMQLLRSQAGRVSGEVSLQQHGVSGRASFEQIKKVAARTGATEAEMKALDRLEAQFLGLPVNGYVPNDTASLTMSALRTLYLGGLVFAQLVETFNLVPAVGARGMMGAMSRFPTLAKEAKALARGEKVNNPLLNELDQMWGGIGKEQYRFLSPVGETGRNDVVAYSNANMSLAHRIFSTMEQAQQRMTFFNALLAAQQRGAAEQILHKAAKFLRNGDNDKALADMGITPELRDKMKAEKDVFVFDKDGNLVEFNPLKAKDAEAMMDFSVSVRRGVGQIFQETFIGERGAWVHNDVWRLLAMFRGYVIGSIQKQLARSVDVHGAWKTAGYIAGAMSFALPIQWAKAHIQSVGMSEDEREKFLDKRLAPDKLAFTALSYTATAGMLAEAASVPLAAFGQDFVTMRMGGKTSIAQLSPALGLAETLWNTPADLVGRENADGETVRSTNNLRRLMPLGATPQIMTIMNLLSPDDDN